MKIYRIYTEGTDGMADAAEREIARRFDGLTRFDGKGFWKGEAEHSVCFEIIATDAERTIVHSAAQNIALAHGQDAVMVTEQSVAVDFIS